MTKKKAMILTKCIINIALLLAGYALLSYAAALIYPPAGYAVGGIILIMLAYAFYKATDDKE